MRIIPKMRVSPPPSRKSNAPYDTPLKSCVTQNSVWRGRTAANSTTNPRGVRRDRGEASRLGVEEAGRLPSSHSVDHTAPPADDRTAPTTNNGGMMKRPERVALLLIVLLLSAALIASSFTGEARAQAKPEGEMRWALYVTLSPQWFDPAEVVGVITPFWVLYALHDALVKPLPGNLMAPSLAESWTVSPDQKTYEFKLREGVKFHNGDPFTAEDVKFSFMRAKSARLIREKVREVTAVGPHRVRFQLHEPWPDFLTFYGTLATAASWVVPKKYVEQVGDEGFKKHPIGLGPYKFVSHTPGIELVMEANESYWRKA